MHSDGICPHMGRNIFYWWFVSILFELGRWPDILLILSDWIQKPVTAVLGGFETDGRVRCQNAV